MSYGLVAGWLIFFNWLTITACFKPAASAQSRRSAA
jgi:hypothetical protein